LPPQAARSGIMARSRIMGRRLVDKSTIGGIFLALGGILAGLLLEGGKISQILQPTAAMIVLGGTIGAVMVQFPLSTVMQAFKGLALVFFDQAAEPKIVIATLVGFANRARKNGIVSLDTELPNIQDPFLKKALMLAVDGLEPDELRKMMELELDNQAEHSEKIAQVFESAGGFAPTIGIIGAVLGLIQVMQHLSNIDEVGKGIAVAFVATIYGVGSANLIFLPSAGKLKIKGREEQVLREMTVEGVVSILEGMNPRILETKLHGYLNEQTQQELQEA
jgi:chemotaxis protein MotA